METMKDRLRVMLGDDRLARLEDARVLVLGCGGVGSSCIEALARGGVGTLIIVDKDVVAPSNINRQAIAFESTVGRRKVDVMAGMIADINPGCRVFAHDAFVLAENLEDFYAICLEEAGGRIDYVVDAIDTVSTKLALAALAQERGLELISSMGGAKKITPSACASPTCTRRSTARSRASCAKSAASAASAACASSTPAKSPCASPPPPGPPARSAPTWARRASCRPSWAR